MSNFAVQRAHVCTILDQLLWCFAKARPVWLQDVAYVAYKTMWKNKPSLKAKLQDPAFFSHLKEAIIVAERALLYMLGFEFTMVNPQRVAIIMVSTCPHHNLSSSIVLHRYVLLLTDQCEDDQEVAHGNAFPALCDDSRS